MQMRRRGCGDQRQTRTAGAPPTLASGFRLLALLLVVQLGAGIGCSTDRAGAFEAEDELHAAYCPIITSATDSTRLPARSVAAAPMRCGPGRSRPSQTPR